MGITFSSNGQWHIQIENIVNTAAKFLGIIYIKQKCTESKIESE